VTRHQIVRRSNANIVQWTSNVSLIKHLGIKLIGCTTTGLSKYRGLLAALESRTILIEEAAETLEGTVVAGMIDSLQQLILVGDHQQLQASCNVKRLEDAPYHMNVSMFERLVINSIGYVMLNNQRRMIPDIRGLLCIKANPFYRNLKDHESVLDPDKRAPIPGMGGFNTYFFHHNWPEARNTDSSSYNQDEAQMIVGHFNHLVFNGVAAETITILTVPCLTYYDIKSY
jgi:helicase required for RNAi-mediated heterochromatin assembly 1